MTSTIMKCGSVAAVIGLYVPVIIGGVWGGIVQAAPCHGGASGRSFLENTVGGVFFGAMYFGFHYSLPLMVVGFFIGGIIGAVRVKILQYRRKNDGDAPQN